jgi:hypothetical protein
MRLAHEWSQGDEHSFPVQLALLTRAQWRAAAQIPQLLDESRALLDLKLNEHRQQITMLVKSFSEVTDAKADRLASLVTAQSQSVTRAASGFEGHLARRLDGSDLRTEGGWKNSGLPSTSRVYARWALSEQPDRR